MCAAVCLLAAVAMWWRMCLRPTPGSAALAGAVAGLAFVAKFSAVLLLPVFLGLGIIALVLPHERPRASALVRLGGASLLAALVAYGIIWGFFGFRYSATDQAVAGFQHFYIPWEATLAKGGLWTHAIELARRWHVLPEAFLYGFSFVMYFSTGRGAFLAGHYSLTGWWWFFPFAFLVKSTIGELLATALLPVRALAGVPGDRGVAARKALISPLLPLALFALVFGAVTLSSNLNIGQRHILPLYLVLFIVTGALFSARTPAVLRVLGAIAVLFSAVETIANSPNHLAFFNRLAGGPQNGWRLLVDSSLDWGQDVAPLGLWVRAHRRPNEPVYISCFGTADPAYEGIEGQVLSPYYSLGKPRAWFELKPGLYCLSATMRQDVYGIAPGLWTETLERDFQNLKVAARINIKNRTWDRKIPESGFHPENPLWLLDRLRFARLCEYLKVRKPDAVINHTEFVFRLSDEEIQTVVDKPLSALVKLMENAAAKLPPRH